MAKRKKAPVARPRQRTADVPRDGQTPLSELDLMLPHERDETSDTRDTGGEQSPGPRQVIEQAHRDVEHGLVDAERRGIPSDVPDRSAPPAQRSPGTRVPSEPIGRARYGKKK